MKLTTYINGRILMLVLGVLCLTGAMAQPGQQVVRKDTLLATGTILDAATGKPLAGINVSVPAYAAAITDDKGKFSIKVPAWNVTLFLSGEGVQARQVPLRGNKDVTVRLYDESFDSYYAAAAMPNGVKPGNEIAAPVATVDPGGAWTRNTESADNLLQGLANGLAVTRRSGMPNVGGTLFLRGINSLYTTNKPLLVVDGMIYDNTDYGGSIVSGHYNNPMSFIDVQDIDNITVIKDGSSTYGTKGGNGVILITTARAREKATRIDLGIYTGVNFAPKGLPVMDAQQYRPYLTDVLQSKGLTQQQIMAQPYMTDDPTSAQYARYHYNTNWQDQVFRNSVSNNAYLKISGGDNIATYALSMGAEKNGGVIKQSDFTRYNMRFNADLNLSKRFTASSALAFTYTEQLLQNSGIAPKVNPVYAALVKAPFMAVNDISDLGAVSPNLADIDTLGMGNPAAIVSGIGTNNKSYRFFGALQFNYMINSALSVSTRIGLTNQQVRENYFVPRKGIVHDTLASAIAYNRSGDQVKRLISVFNETKLQYSKTFHRIHSLDMQLGVRYQQQSFEQDYAFGFNSATDELKNVGYGVPALRQVGGDKSKNRWLNTFLNADYSYDNRFFVNGGLAVDGSSRFGSEVDGGFRFNSNTYSLLPYAGAAWLLSSEAFMRSMPAISLLRLRAGYSLSGNDDIGDNTARQYYVSQNLYGQQGLIRGNIANPHIQWEVNKKITLGVDLGLLDDRLRISADVYRNSTSRMVVMEPVPSPAGFDYVANNSGAMRTTGIELNADLRIINQETLKWDLGMSVAAYRNKITAVPGGRIITPFAGGEILTQEGKAANLFYGYKTNGVYSSDAAAAAIGDSAVLASGATAAFKGGDMRFVNTDGNKRIDGNDRQVIGDPNPDFTGSFHTNIAWKRFTLNVLFTFSKGNDVYNYTRARLESGNDYSNQLVSQLNRWRVQGQVTNMPKAAWGDPMGNGRFSDRWIEDGSYLRLRNISLAYNVKIKPGFFRYITVYASASNLFTITKYLGYDPEFSATESPLGQGVDTGLQPQFKSCQGGVRIGL